MKRKIFSHLKLIQWVNLLRIWRENIFKREYCFKKQRLGGIFTKKIECSKSVLKQVFETTTMLVYAPLKFTMVIKSIRKNGFKQRY